MLSIDGRRLKFGATAVACLMMVFAGPLSAGPDDTPNMNELIEALKSKGTRGVDGAQPVAPEARDPETEGLIRMLQGKLSRGLSVTETERTKLAKVSKSLPKFDHEVSFDFNSDKLSDKAFPYLRELGRAMQSEDLKDSTFVIGGHTDAKGSAAYNQKLSERRAQAVSEYLSRTFNIAPERLMAIGYGEEQLKLPNKPNSEENRRVQIVNVTSAVTASK